MGRNRVVGFRSTVTLCLFLETEKLELINFMSCGNSVVDINMKGVW
jgi:hypothetical protein